MASNILKPPATRPTLAMRPRQAAEALGVSEKTLWTWTQEGDVPHVRIGRAVLYPVHLLQRWLERQAQNVPENVPVADDDSGFPGDCGSDSSPPRTNQGGGA